MRLLPTLIAACLLGCPALLAATPAAAQAPPAAPPELAECGLDDASIPDFTLVDQNANSPTYGQSLSLSDHAGKVVLIFWMTGT